MLRDLTALPRTFAELNTFLTGAKTVQPALEQLAQALQGKYPRAEKAIEKMLNNCKNKGFASYWD